MAVVWPCRQSIDGYIRAGRRVSVPALACPQCRAVLASGGGYHRQLRWRNRRHLIWIQRGYCRRCNVSHALLPDFVVANHLDTVDDIADAVQGLPTPLPAGTVAGWRRRYRNNTSALNAGIAAVVVAHGAWPNLRHSIAEKLAMLHSVLETRHQEDFPTPWRLLNVISGMSWIGHRVKSFWAGVGRVPITARSP